jgi:hypothetical protein
MPFYIGFKNYIEALGPFNPSPSPSPSPSDDGSAAMSISSDGNEELDRWQCCECELYKWIAPGNFPGETCWKCGHEECEACVRYRRVKNWVLGLPGVEENGVGVEEEEEEMVVEEDEDEEEEEEEEDDERELEDDLV